MFFDRLFLRVALALFCSVFCASEMLAVPPGGDEAKPKISIKRTSHGSEKEYQQGILTIPATPLGQLFATEAPSPEDGHTRDSKKQKATHESSKEDSKLWADIIAAADAAEEEYYRSHPKQASLTPATNPVDEATFWADAIVAGDTAVGEHLRRQQNPTSLTPPASSQDSVSSQQASPVPSAGTQGTDVNPHNSTSEEDLALLAAVIAAEEKYSQGQVSQSSPSPITHGQESCASQTPGFSSPASESGLDEDAGDHFEGFRYRPLTTPQDHQQHLIDAINKANRSVLITSNALSADLKEGSDLFEAVKSACYRGVKLYFYAKEISLQERTVAAMDRLRNLKFNQAEVHSKLLVVDNKQITCGSYDWLSGPWYDENRSLFLEGGDLEPVIDRIWHVLKKYRTVDFHPGSYRAVEDALRTLPPVQFQFKNPENTFELINTPHGHDALFQECFELAQKQITICAPFITADRRFLQDILPRTILLPFLRSGKQLHIFYRAGGEKVTLLTDHIDQTLSGRYSRFRQNVTLTPIERLHQKSLFVDDDLYIEGSYNWFSSARTLGGVVKLTSPRSPSI